MMQIPAKNELMRRIQALEFTAIDLVLYLDTHPDDARALTDYNQIACALSRTKSTYEQQYGPLSSYGMTPAGRRWSWIDEPWPWHVEEEGGE